MQEGRQAQQIAKAVKRIRRERQHNPIRRQRNTPQRLSAEGRARWSRDHAQCV